MLSESIVSAHSSVQDDATERDARRATDDVLLIPLTGMTCTGCAKRIERVLAAVPGARFAEVNFATRTAKVALADPAEDLPLALEAIAAAGYEPAANAEQILARRGAAELAKAEHRARRRDARHAMIALAIASLQMVFSMPLMAHGAAMRPSMAGPAMHPLLRWALLVSTLVVIVIARSFFVRAWSALRRRTADMNTLVALGSGTAFLYSTLATVRPAWFAADGGVPDVHFETASFILAFVLLGRVIESRARAGTASAQTGLLALVPAFAKVLRDEVEVRVASPAVREGDVFVLRPGDRAPADGIITQGGTQLDEALLTGESRRVPKREGDEIHAGTLVVDGMVRARATRTGRDTRLGRIAALVEDAQATRAPIQRTADRIASYFVPGIVAVAAVAAALWWALGPEPKLVHSVTTFVTVVVVSCPCALGLATPMAIATAIGRAAQLGILVRSGEALERIAQIDTVALDKTGTLTEGEPEMVDFVVVVVEPAAPGDERRATTDEEADAVLRLAAAVERGSEHPVGEAIVREAEERSLAIPEPTGFVATAGAGASADVEGQRVSVGSIAWLGREGVAMPESGPPDAAFGVAVDGVLRGHGRVADRLRDDAREAVAGLARLGVRVLVVTGDRDDVARAVGKAIGVDDVRSELAPEQKLEVLEALARSGRRVAMCGDGVNDAPALAKAHVGIAVGTGTDAAVEASDVTLFEGGAARLPDTVELARRTLRVIRQNLAWAFAYNLALVPVAAGVLAPLGYRMPPALASAAMALSSVSVVLSSLRLRRFEPTARGSAATRSHATMV
jgi:P-type Cu+ transporter